VLLSRFHCMSSVSCAEALAAARQLQPMLPSYVCVLHKRMRSGMKLNYANMSMHSRPWWRQALQGQKGKEEVGTCFCLLRVR
jgi:hypothetical protein